MSKIKKPTPGHGNLVGAPHGSGGSTQTELVRFSFKFLRVECAEYCDIEELRAFTKRLHMLSTMTWQQVNQSHRHGAGFEKIPRDQLKVPCSLSDDVIEVLSFRYGHGKQPMLGYREGAILHVLWVSHGHDAYAG